MTLDSVVADANNLEEKEEEEVALSSCSLVLADCLLPPDPLPHLTDLSLGEDWAW